MTSRYEVYKTLKTLTPWDLEGEKKIRIGSCNDGGYILVDRFDNCDVVLSFGAGHDISFEKYFANIGKKVFLCDPYENNIEVDNINIQFSPIGLKATPAVDVVSYDLAHIIDIFSLRSKKMLVLKIDIEGDEWDIFDAASDVDLEIFPQIVVEFHWFNNLIHEEFCAKLFRVFTKINKQFTLHHVHANNCADIINIAGFPVADVIELSYIRSDLVKRKRNRGTFPTKIDFSNDRLKPDHLLWFFPFLPSHLDSDEVDGRFGYFEEQKPSSFNISTGALPRILYYSVHEILEFDELRMFSDMGYSVFSYVGAYSDPSSVGHLRRPQSNFFNPKMYDEFKSKGGITPDFLRNFDVAVVMHSSEAAIELLNCRPDMPIILRSIGQSTPDSEKLLLPIRDKIKIIRYSIKERDLPGFMKTDDVIYFGKYLSDFKSWQGGGKLLTFHNSLAKRSYVSAVKIDFYERISEIFPSVLCGAGNELIKNWGGIIAPDDMAAHYANCGLYFYVQVLPPSYTLNFMEALGTGAPVIAPSAEFMCSSFPQEMLSQLAFPAERYEVDDFLNHDDALLYHSFDDAVQKIRWLLDNPAYLESVSKSERLVFREYFDARKISRQWNGLFLSL